MSDVEMSPVETLLSLRAKLVESRRDWATRALEYSEPRSEAEKIAMIQVQLEAIDKAIAEERELINRSGS